MHLVEYQFKMEESSIDYEHTRVEFSHAPGFPAIFVYGAAGKDKYQSIVHASAARVMSIRRNDTLRYKWSGPKIVAHRGNVTAAPENTLPALDKAIELGADLIEIDIRQTRDGKLVLMHDATVNRTTNGTGLISQLSYQEIEKLDAGSWFGTDFKGTKIPTLQEALQHMRGKAIPDIDFKDGDPVELIRVLDHEGFLTQGITLYCGDWELLNSTLELTKSLLARPTVPFGLKGLPELLEEINPPIVNINWEQFSQELTRQVHLTGKKSFVNTMQQDTQMVMRLMLKSLPDYIQSDHLDILKPLLNEFDL
jgi:glycerophosphoryl diester phosphodiesterase